MSGAAPITFRDRLLPCQPVFRERFAGEEQEFHTVLYETVMRFSRLRLPTEEFVLELPSDMPVSEMASNPVHLRFLELLVLLRRPRRVLEIGTFIGISAMSMARMLPEESRLVTMEKYPKFAELARRNFRANRLDHKIRLIEGNALEQLARMGEDRFDMIFLDGDKGSYDRYLALLEPMLLPDGLLVTDDVFFHGDALNERPTTEKGRGVRAFLEVAERRRDYHSVILPIGNGMMLMYKRSAA